MRIGIDARMYGYGFGLARYVSQLILHLEQIDFKNEYIVFLRKENWDEFQPKNPNFKKVLANVHWYGFAEQIYFPHLIRKEKVDLMHFAHFNVPVLYRAPFVVTIHDLIMLHNFQQGATTRNPLVYWFKHTVLEILLRVITHRAAHIFATSEFTKQDIHNTLGVTQKKMTVTYQAAYDQVDFTLLRQEKIHSILQEYKINKPYLIYVGACYPHKNLERLLAAWKVFQKKYGTEYQLVLVGKENFFYKRLKQKIDTECTDVIYTGFLSDELLSSVYAGARLYIFPSLYEGFGLPPLEAMTHAVPVVSSNKSCLPEVLADAALYFDPENIEEMAGVIYHGLTDDALRKKLMQNSRQLLPKYSWKTLAEKTLDIYKTHVK